MSEPYIKPSQLSRRVLRGGRLLHFAVRMAERLPDGTLVRATWDRTPIRGIYAFIDNVDPAFYVGQSQDVIQRHHEHGFSRPAGWIYRLYHANGQDWAAVHDRLLWVLLERLPTPAVVCPVPLVTDLDLAEARWFVYFSRRWQRWYNQPKSLGDFERFLLAAGHLDEYYELRALRYSRFGS